MAAGAFCALLAGAGFCGWAVAGCWFWAFCAFGATKDLVTTAPIPPNLPTGWLLNVISIAPALPTVISIWLLPFQFKLLPFFTVSERTTLPSTFTSVQQSSLNTAVTSAPFTTGAGAGCWACCSGCCVDSCCVVCTGALVSEVSWLDKKNTAPPIITIKMIITRKIFFCYWI